MKTKPILILFECGLLAGFAAWYCLPSADQFVRPVDVSLRSAGELGPAGIARFESPADLAAAYPGREAALPEGVDWDADSLLRVRWDAAGLIPLDQPAETRQTLYDTLTWRSQRAGRVVYFHVASPIGYGNVGATFQRICHEDWFRVPKQAAARFTDTFHLATTDIIFATGMIVGVVLVVATGRASQPKLARHPLAGRNGDAARS